MIDILCAFCGKPHRARRASRKFCSDNCKQKALTRRRSPLVDKACDVCGTMFHQNKRHQRYCSERCYTRAWQNNNRALYNANASKNAIRRRAEARSKPVACPGCGNMFVRPHATQRYCTPACHVKYYTKANRKKVNGWRQKYFDGVRQKMPWMPFLVSAKARAKKHGLPFDLTPEWAQRVWNGKCAVCQLDFVLDQKRHALSPSIDKIVPALGYVQSNCRFVAWAVNRFKGENPDADIFVIAKAMAIAAQ